MTATVAAYPVQQPILQQHAEERSYLQKCKVPAYVRTFAQLASKKPEEITEEETASVLADRSAFHQMVLDSLPIWPVDADAIEAIVLEGAGSKHPLVRQRALIACSYLVTTQGAEKGYKAAAELAAAKMRSGDAGMQSEGLEYFRIVLKQWQPDLSNEELGLAIGIARKVFLTDRWTDASSFFEILLQHGKPEHCVLMKEALLEFCQNGNCPYSIAFGICDKIVCSTKSKELLAIPLEAARRACASEEPSFRKMGIDLYWRLLSWHPEECMDGLLEAILVESRREDPCVGLLGRLGEVAGHDFSNLFHRAREVVTARAAQDAPVLIEALENLSRCKSAYFVEQAGKLKAVVEARLKEAAEAAEQAKV